MHRLNYIFKNINLLNIILIAAIILLANYTFLPIFNKSAKFNLPPVKQPVGHKDEKPAESSIPSPSDYTMIAEENLFHPGRKIPVEKSEENPLPKPEFILYGTMITDNLRLAYIEDLKAPQTTQGRGKRQVVLRKGNSLSGFTLKEIDSDKVVMVRGDETIVVNVTDSKKGRIVKDTSNVQIPSTQKTPAHSPPLPKRVPPNPSIHR
jgi:hypothetical protein